MGIGIMGKVLRIFLRPERRKPVVEVSQAEAKVGTGLEGDHLKSGSRQITILSQEAWDETCKDLGKKLDPIHRRANLLVEGLDLKDSKGKIITLGAIQIKITGETTPCRLMDDEESGLKDALIPDWRGGVFGEVQVGGSITVGDEISLS